nr:reverse transcriptase domain-containing protein [Tanacetum cinerariifolium]
MDDPNITMKEYIRFKEKIAHRRGKVYNWEIATYGKIWYDEDVHGLISVETEFPAIVFNDTLTSDEALSCEPTVSPLNDNKIDFRISFDDEDYTVIYDKNSFSYKIISVNDLKRDSENDNDKVNMPSFPSPELENYNDCGLIPSGISHLNETPMFVHKIRDRCKLLLHAWYLDDGTVIGDSKEVARVLDNIKVCGPGLGLELNVNKKEIFWPSCNGVKLREGLFPVDIRRPSFCVKLLRGAVSRDPDFISGMAMRRLTNSIDLMNLLSQLHDPQSELLLFRSCMGISKLFFGLRTCQPVHKKQAACFFYKGLRGSIENIVFCEGPFFEDLQWWLASLPIRLGGLGFYSAKKASSYAFVASRA